MNKNKLLFSINNNKKSNNKPMIYRKGEEPIIPFNTSQQEQTNDKQQHNKPKYIPINMIKKKKKS